MSYHEQPFLKSFKKSMPKIETTKSNLPNNSNKPSNDNKDLERELYNTFSNP